jgi:hypothetical protein
MKTRHLQELGDDQASLHMSAAKFSRTPLGRAALHLECLCHHPAAARFYFHGLARNLRESAVSAKQSALKSLRKTFGHRVN